MRETRYQARFSRHRGIVGLAPTPPLPEAPDGNFGKCAQLKEFILGCDDILNFRMSIGVQWGPPLRCVERLMLGACFALLAAQGGRSPTGGGSSAESISEEVSCGA